MTDDQTSTPHAHPEAPPSEACSAGLTTFENWCLDHAAEFAGIDPLFRAVADLLDRLGFGFDRITFNLEMLHPEIGGQGHSWVRGSGAIMFTAARGIERSEEYKRSPVRMVDQTGQAQRFDLAAGQGQDLPLLARLAGEGFTDYMILPLRFVEKSRSAAASFAVRTPGGFSAEQVQAAERIVRAISPILESRVTRTIAVDLLTTYLGQGAGERVLNGQIRRGDASSIFAAVLFCDLRGFTAFTQDHLSEAVLGRLNDWFELAVAAVEANRGEVLKFIGDGMLAIFPADEFNPQEACGHALAASLQLNDGVNGWNERAPAASVPLDYGLSLHLGYVAFGNIGGARRLDFTVIGPTVNLASRLMDVAKQCDRRVVVSQAFAGCSGQRFEPLGSFALRGLADPVPVFAPQPPT